MIGPLLFKIFQRWTRPSLCDLCYVHNLIFFEQYYCWECDPKFYISLLSEFLPRWHTISHLSSSKCYFHLNLPEAGSAGGSIGSFPVSSLLIGRSLEWLAVIGRFAGTWCKEGDEEWWAGSDHHGRVLPHRALVLILAKIRNNTICCKIYFPLRSFLSLISTLVLKLTNDD